ncbi:MAG: hypothetical protein K6F01_09175 [Selenomonas sp.]|uniref:hypothetical protein n=1 Tax=Selenomonas sp. TaxID=2053611 RepID=UPI0025CBE1C6|nr:hypothetical protein [Selenomonas sp.]MCR5439586.1 hypothetical protein [Selenomonas sp.]
MMKQTRRPRFVIVSPPQLWGGTIVLHLLCRMLIDRGYDAKIFLLRVGERIPSSRQELLQKYLPFMNGKRKQVLDNQKGPIKGCNLTNWPYVDDDTIVVYPEVVFGNILAAKHVVRWFLNVNRFTGEYEGEQPYGKEDMFICYRDVFNDYQLNPSGRQVTLRHFDYDLYKRWNYGYREGSCFIIRKGENRADLPPNVPGIVLDNLSEEEKVEVMNQCRYCYSFDTQTFYSNIAAICGCVSIVIPEPGKTREDYLSAGEKGWGIAYGTASEEIEFARKTCKKLEEEIESFRDKNNKNLQNFLDYCREYFKDRMDAEICW